MSTIDSTVTSKECTSCRTIKLLTQFSKSKHGKFHRMSACKTCRCEYLKEYRQKNRAKCRAQSRNYYQSSREKRCHDAKVYYAKNRERCIARHKRWQQTNGEKVRTYQRAYNKAHPEAKRSKDKRYRETHREAKKLRDKIYRQTHMAQKCLRDRQYREATRERQIILHRNYYQTHRDSMLAYGRSRYKTHKARILARNLTWKLTHRDTFKAIQMRHRAAKARAPINDFTGQQWMAMQEFYGHRCHYCKKRYKGRLTQDHVIPLSKGGAHTASNIVPSCHSCNCRKRDRPPPYPVQPLLIELLEPPA